MSVASGGKRQQIVLVVGLFVVLAAVVYWEFGPAGTPGPASNPKTGPAATAASAPAPGGAQTGGAKPASGELPKPLNLAALDQVPTEGSATRNPFKFYTPPPPPAPPRPQTPQTPIYVPPLVPQGPPPPPPITLKFIGVVEQGGKRVAMLTDGKAQFFAVEGGIIDGRYRVVKIGLESVQVEYVNGLGRTTIPLRS